MTLTPLQFDDEPLQCSTTLLLLLTSRREMDPRSADLVRNRADGNTDWQRFTDLAASKFSLPFALRHLRSTAPEYVPDDVMQRMTALSQNFGLATRKIAAAQIEFH